jgi:PUA domain protein
LKQLSKSEIAALNKEILDNFDAPDFFSKKDKVVLTTYEDFKVIEKDKARLFFYIENKLIPTLKLLLEKPLLKKITVDMGAVKFVTNGADIMRPGITKIDDGIKKGEFVAVVDETHGKPLAVCEALHSSEELNSIDSGKVLKNIHYIGDKLWSSTASFGKNHF